MKKIIFAIFILGLSGCAVQPTYLPINPSVNIPASNIGHQAKLGFTVSDRRLSDKMSDNNTTANMKVLQTSDDIVNKIAAQVNQIIASYNFTPTGYDNQSQRTLKAELLSINIGEQQRKNKRMYYIQVAIMANAKNNKAHYRYIYRGISYSPATWSGYSKEAMTKDINAAYSQALMAMGNDKKLWQFLAK